MTVIHIILMAPYYIQTAALVNLSAAYDTVQHRLMIRKLMDMTGDIGLCQVIVSRGLLSNRRFFVQQK